MEINKVQIWTKTQMLETEIKSQEDIDRLTEKLKELINEKWEPKEGKYHLHGDGHIASGGGSYGYVSMGCSFKTEELAETARDMNKRNQLILQAKHEMGYGDGYYKITFGLGIRGWCVMNDGKIDNPELTFETQEQAAKIISMVGLNG